MPNSLSPLIFILGSPRSGTSWVGKTFDSHPETLYRMEPDTVLRGDYPFVADTLHTEEAAAHISKMANLKTLKVTGSRPTFKKAGQSELAHQLRTGLLYGFKGLERLDSRFAGLALPDLCSRKDKTLVIKSVSSLGRAASWRAAAPKARFVLILRHPCGHVASTLRGQGSGNLVGHIPLGFEDCRIARKYQIDRPRLEAMSEAERIAWRWVIANETVMRDCPEAITVRYEDLCANPHLRFRELFDQLGLAWCDEVNAFLNDSTSSGDGSYFETRRSPLKAANRWKKDFELGDDIWNLIKDTEPARLFADEALRVSA